MAWFLRGAQSAFFYYVSCAPCANARFNHRRAKEKARVDKATKKALLQNAARHGDGDLAVGEKLPGDDHDLLAGVGAFTTNISWQHEIDMGPNFMKGMRPRQDIARDRKENKKSKKRRLTSATKSTQGDVAGVGSAGATASMDSLRAEDANGAAEGMSRSLSSVSGNVRYQRPDEALWGNPFPEKDWSFYSRGRNPSINSLTPPVVSTLPATADEASWMLQPPPPAKVMEGKQAPATQRTASFGAASKASRLSRVSKRSGGTRFSELKRPERVIIADLGDDICSMSLPVQSERKVLRMIAHNDGTDDSSRPTTPTRGHMRNDSAFSTFDSPQRTINRINRPAPIQTYADSENESGRDANGFDAYWRFPRGQTPMSGASSNLDRHYYSEPEPDVAYTHGISYQDFATRPPALVRVPTTAESDAPFQTPKSKATTRAGSDSPSPTTLSSDSSSSSLHDLRDVLASAKIVDSSKEAGEGKPAISPTGMEGITEEEVDGGVPRYYGAPREFRLSSGTQV